MSDTTIEPKTNPAPAPVPEDKIRQLVAKATANPALLEFPTDKWGFTSGIKKEILKAASTVRGQDDKHDLLVGTLAVLIRHIQLRKASDKATEDHRRSVQEAARAERAPRERVGASVAAPLTNGEPNG